MTKKALMFFVSFALCLWPARALCCAFGGGPLPDAGLFEIQGKEVRHWAQDAYDNPPVLLTIRVAEEAELASVEIDDPKIIRAYLDALALVKVDMNEPETPSEDAPEKTYAFRKWDGSIQSFVFQQGMAFINPYAAEGHLLEATGLERLEALDRAFLAGREALGESVAWHNDAVGFQGGDVHLLLEENPAAGYLWSYIVQPEDALVLIGDEQISGGSIPAADSTGCERRYTFRAVSRGRAVIRLTLAGPDGLIKREIAFAVRAGVKGIEAVERVSADN